LFPQRVVSFWVSSRSLHKPRLLAHWDILGAERAKLPSSSKCAIAAIAITAAGSARLTGATTTTTAALGYTSTSVRGVICIGATATGADPIGVMTDAGRFADSSIRGLGRPASPLMLQVSGRAQRACDRSMVGPCLGGILLKEQEGTICKRFARSAPIQRAGGVATDYL
jgi:hypothetical protein